MARNGEIKGRVEYDVTFDADDGLAKLQSAVEGVTARIDVSFGKMQVRAALKEATAGYAHKVDVAFTKTQVRKALKTASAGLTAKADVQFTKTQVRAALKTATAGMAIRMDVDAADLRTKVATIVAKTEKATTEIHQRESERRKTLDKRLRAENEIAETRANQRIRILDRQRRDALIRLDRQDAQIRERINAQLNARIEAQNNQSRLREAYAANRERQRLERQAAKPLIQRVLVQTDRINSSLAEFDRSMTRALRTSLTAFTVWSAGVVAAVGAATGAALVSFARMEQEVARAGAVFASDAFYGNLIRGEKQLRSFKEEATFTSEAVRQLSNSIALETLFNPREIAEGAKAMAQAGVSLADTQAQLSTVAQFAQNEQIGLADATEKLTGSINSAGLSMSKITSLTDKFTLAANSTNATASEMADAFSNQAAAAFRSYGYEVDEAITTIGLFAKANLRGLEAGTQTSILVREITRSAFVKAPAAWKKYGIALEDANGKAVPFNETLISLVQKLEEVRKTDGNRGMAKLRKELELTEKSMRGLTILQPLVNELGIEGLNEFTRMLNKSAGATARQSSVVTDTIAFEWGNLLENIAIQFQNFGSKSAAPLKRLFDQFNGAGGIIDQLTPKVEALGERFAVLVDRFADWVTSPEAARGAEILIDAVRITLVGVRDAFKAFASAFGDSDKPRSTFEAVAESIRGFSRVSAATLPVVAEIIGNIFDLLIDNADAFEAFAKLAVAVFLLRKAYGVIIKPIATVTSLVIAQAAAYGIMGGAANKATASIAALTAAQTAQARASTASTVAAGVGALGSIPGFGGRGFFRNRNRATAIGARGREGVDALGSGSSHAGAALATRNAAAFDRLTTSMNLANASGKGLTGTLGRMGWIGAAIAGSLVIGKGAVDGFGQSLDDASGKTIGMETSMDRLARSMAPLTSSISFAMSSITNEVEELGNAIGYRIGQLATSTLNSFADTVAGVALRIQGDMEGSDDAFSSLENNIIKAGAAARFFTPASGELATSLVSVSNSSEAAGDGIDYASGKMDTSVSVMDRLIGRYYALRDAQAAIDLKAKNTTWFTAMQRRNAAARRQVATEKEIASSVAAYTDAMKKATAASGVGAADTGAAQSTERLATAAEVASQAVDRMNDSAVKSTALQVIGRAANGAAGGYKATRVEAEVLRRVLPSLDRELESQRATVQKLDQALQALQSTQLKGTRAFSDQLFANEQQVNALQLQRVDLLIGGTSEEDSAIVSIDDQIRALQLQAERTSLSESLQLDPLRRKLQDAFNPLNELPFEKIMADLRAIQKQRAPLADAIAGGENLRAVLDKTIGEAEARFEVAGKDVSSGLARGVIAGSKDLLAAGRKSGQSVFQGLNSVMEFGSPSRAMHRHGVWASLGLAGGIRSGAPAANSAAMDVARGTMASFLAGLKAGFGTPEAEQTPAWYLNVFIPDWIRKNKGPLAYDSTILVPAGHAVMEGFGKGLRDGFSQITGFVKQVGPSLGEYISSEAFGDRTAKIMADIAIGKTPDIEGVLGDLRGASIGMGMGFSGPIDPTLSFLHQTMSLADTQRMAAHLGKLFGVTVTSTDRAFGGPNPNSRHPYGEAADLSNGSQPTPQMDALAGAMRPLLGKIFDQILYRTMIGGNHFNHVHLDWIAAKGFSKHSGKFGQSGFDIPGIGGPIEAAINAAAAKYHLNPSLIAAIAKQESGFRPNVVSPDGGYGLMQLTSAGLVAKARAKGNIFDPFVNVDVGAAYFKQLLERFDGNIFKALMGYNGGPGAGENPFAQVIRYANSVLAIFRQFGGAREHGGPVSAGKTYLVGEKGPELWTASRAGAIVDAATTGRIMAGNQAGASGPVYHDNSQTHITTAATDPDVIIAKLERKRRRKFNGVNTR